MGDALLSRADAVVHGAAVQLEVDSSVGRDEGLGTVKKGFFDASALEDGEAALQEASSELARGGEQLQEAMAECTRLREELERSRASAQEEA